MGDIWHHSRYTSYTTRLRKTLAYIYIYNIVYVCIYARDCYLTINNLHVALPSSDPIWFSNHTHYSISNSLFSPWDFSKCKHLTPVHMLT